jgi:hypothetical protein
MSDAKFRQEGGDWMYQCLVEAKSMIKKYHIGYNAKKFFEDTTYELYIEKSENNIYVDLLSDSDHFPIGINLALSDDTPENQRVLVMVFVHHLLHAIHDREGLEHDKIILLENNIANLGGYSDSLVELQRVAKIHKMKFCRFA